MKMGLYGGEREMGGMICGLELGDDGHRSSEV